MIEVLKGARTVDFTTPITEAYHKLQLVREDARYNKTAKPYLETIKSEYRNQIKFLYMAADQAYPEDGVKVSHAISSFGPEAIFDKYEFKVIVAKK